MLYLKEDNVEAFFTLLGTELKVGEMKYTKSTKAVSLSNILY